MNHGTQNSRHREQTYITSVIGSSWRTEARVHRSAAGLPLASERRRGGARPMRPPPPFQKMRA
eukprot:2489149-Pyramimonas_sp.AAC.1